jgi:predicted secreted protein
MKRVNSLGFSAVEVILILLVISLIGGVGFYVFQTKKAANNTYNDASKALTGIKPDAKKTPVTTNTPDQQQPSNSPALADVIATDTDKGKTITLVKGQNLIVQLSSTYWTIHDSSNTGVIKMVGQPEIKPTGRPGVGGGTVTAHFTAVSAGSANVSADRTSCGEGRTCEGDQGEYQITVVVK